MKSQGNREKMIQILYLVTQDTTQDVRAPSRNGIEQFKKLDKFIMQRQKNANKFISTVRETLIDEVKTFCL